MNSAFWKRHHYVWLRSWRLCSLSKVVVAVHHTKDKGKFAAHVTLLLLEISSNYVYQNNETVRVRRSIIKLRLLINKLCQNVFNLFFHLAKKQNEFQLDSPMVVTSSIVCGAAGFEPKLSTLTRRESKLDSPPATAHFLACTCAVAAQGQSSKYNNWPFKSRSKWK